MSYSGEHGAVLFYVLIPGAVMLILTVWLWSGRPRFTRFWVAQEKLEGLVLALLPGVGLLFFSTGIGVVFGLGGQLTGPLFLLVWVFSVVLAFGGLFYLPKWWGPRWYRHLTPEERDPVRHDPAAAAVYARTHQPRHTSDDRAADMFAGQEQLARWGGWWVYDADTRDRTHALTHSGAVVGRLTTYPGAVVFTATRADDALREETTVIPIPTGHITGIRTVPPRAGADGQPRKGWIHRSLFPRLVIDTTTGPYLFEFAFGRTKAVAARLGTLTGIRTQPSTRPT